MPKTVHKRQSTIVRQGQILEAARKLILKYGSENITVRRIAAAIGVSEGAIYRHFKSKREILSLLVEDIEEVWLQDIEQSRGLNHSPLGILDNIAKNHISLVEQRKGISFQVVAEIISLGDKRLNNKIGLVIRTYTDRISEVLSEGVNAGEIREDLDIGATSTLFFSMTQGLVSIWVLDDYGFNLEDRYTRLWQTFLHALTREPRS